MIGISTGFGCNLPCLIPGKIIFIHEDSHQFSHSYRRMGVIQLESHFLMEFANVIMLTHILGNCLLNGSGDKEVLLL